MVCFARASLLIILFLYRLTVHAQAPVYKPFEVDTVARVQGGSAALDDFVQANLRRPMSAFAQGLSGRVILTAIVEPDGRVSDVTVVRGLRPDCDRAAQHAFSLFRAWRSARRDGKVVRQQVTYSVVFKAQKPFRYIHGTQVTFLDYREIPLADSSAKVRYKQVAPIGEDGIPTGDIVLYKRRGATDWQESKRYRLTRTEIRRDSATGKRIYRIGYPDPGKGGWYNRVYDVDEDGLIRAVNRWGKEGLYESSTYAANGMLIKYAFRTDLLADQGFVPCLSQTEWYSNGQIRRNGLTQLDNGVERTYDLWDSTGVKIIHQGKGSVRLVSQVPSYADSTRHTYFLEQGSYEKGCKQGVWTGRFEDNSYGYNEFYKDGLCQRGKVWRAGRDTLQYKTAEQQPKFVGGQSGLSRFLRDNLHYPADLQQTTVQGDVVVEFTVCADGTLCEDVVQESVHPALDQEALRLVQAMSGHWTPGVRRGEAVRSRFRLPVSFRLR